MPTETPSCTLLHVPEPLATLVCGDPRLADDTPPPASTMERWAFDYIRTPKLAEKLEPPDMPSLWEPEPPARDIQKPGRPEFVRVRARAVKSPSLQALASPLQRAKLIHAFLHHELQAAELCCWALLKFVDCEPAFRRGLVHIALDEARHARLYADHLHQLGSRYGDFPVRDWFWERVPLCQSALQFVALMGLGLEAANLEHAERFACAFDAAGDAAGAELQRRIGQEEVGHVRFGRHWLECWLGAPVEFTAWKALLPHPLSPLLMRGQPLNWKARLDAGIPEAFLRQLQAWQPDDSGS